MHLYLARLMRGRRFMIDKLVKINDFQVTKIKSS